MEVLKLVFCTVIFFIPISLSLNENICNDFLEPFPSIPTLSSDSYCKKQPDLTHQKCASTADCLIYGSMAICGPNNMCSCGTLKSKSGNGRELNFRLGLNPDPNSFFTHSCILLKNQACPVGLGPFCETSYCYQCMCIDPPIEDRSYKAQPIFPRGREKSNCLNKLPEDSIMAQGAKVAGIGKGMDDNRIDGVTLLPPGHGYTLGSSSFIEKDKKYKEEEEAPLSSLSNIQIQQRQPDDQSLSEEYSLPLDLLLPNPENYMEDIVNKRIIYLRQRNIEGHKGVKTEARRKKDLDNGISKQASSILIQIACILIRGILN